uniref:Uncharacterized protein n=1 Tax=Noccaea caerulescens TaxID=107243 RepID=A0A1J3K2T4_NOCCA
MIITPIVNNNKEEKTHKLSRKRRRSAASPDLLPSRWIGASCPRREGPTLSLPLFLLPLSVSLHFLCLQVRVSVSPVTGSRSGRWPPGEEIGVGVACGLGPTLRCGAPVSVPGVRVEISSARAYRRSGLFEVELLPQLVLGCDSLCFRLTSGTAAAWSLVCRRWANAIAFLDPVPPVLCWWLVAERRRGSFR